MSAALEQPFAVPRESIGQARALRNTVIAGDKLATKAIVRIAAPIQARTAKGCIPRPEMLTEAARQWRERLAGPGRLDLTIEQTRNRLAIRELRFGAADFILPGWALDEPEPGFCILVMEMSVQRRTCNFNSAMLASLSLHSIGRWYQRNFDLTTAALRADVAVVASKMGGVDLVDEAKFSIPVAAGRWVGTVRRVLDDGLFQQVLAIRTFLTD